MRPAVFLDRDGTLMEEVDYCRDPKDVHVFPGVSQALWELKNAGFLCIVITNQAGIGRGYFTDSEYQLVHEEFLRQIGHGVIDGTYYCPDAPANASNRRKPCTGMVEEAQIDFDIDLSRSFFVGDKLADVECGRRAGTTTILVKTGYGQNYLDSKPNYIAATLPVAVDWILSRPR